ncbi:large conductance mechanosensitive channel protein MscL [Cellulomonas sp. DKR-3]|uniref:Large-conductance mechanosensitive channel n=1 Tax=Cellulomonas fulva TaxID=2835530 RepID=A0ABS5TUW7_9CELL|nr:large conductance mechanosensitive channel protein MscL [Cellulomonas fulva]
MLNGFKEFIARGSVVDLAVGVVIGAAFAAVVDAFVAGFISPLIGWVFGQPNLVELWDIGPYSWGDEGGDPIKVGLILQALLTFLITAAAIYFLIVLPMNALAARRKRGEEPEPAAPAEDILLLQEIRDLLAQRPGPAVVADVSTPPTTLGPDGHPLPGTPGPTPGPATPPPPPAPTA